MVLENMIEHASELNFIIEIALLLATATLGGWIATKCKMPAVLGQIVVGIIIGPTVLALVDGNNELIRVLSEIGVIFLMFLAGLETDLKELKSSGKGAIIVAAGGIIFPLIIGTIVSIVFFSQYLPSGDSKPIMYALYIGTILTATSVSISVSVLRDMNQLNGKQGVSILGAAIIDDVIGIILLAIVTGFVMPNDSGSGIGMLIVKIMLFFALALVVGFFMSKLLTRFSQNRAWKDRIITIAIISCFIFAYVSEMFSVAAITGAFIAGVIYSTTPYKHKVVNGIHSIAYALFTPIFFVSIGLKADISSDVINYLGYAVVLVIVAIGTKFIGCGLGAKLANFTTKQSFQIGAGMIARAEVALIVATQGLVKNIISNETFTSIVLIVVVSTLVAPPLLKYLFKSEENSMNIC